LNDDIEALLGTSEHQAALPLVSELIEHTRELEGDTSLKYAAALEEKAELYVVLDNLDAAKGLYHLVLQLRLDKLGRHHEVTADTERALRDLVERTSPKKVIATGPISGMPVDVYAEHEVIRISDAVLKLGERGRYKEAAHLAAQAVKFADQMLGKEHPAYSTSLNNLAGLYQAMGDYARAEPHYVQALEIMDKALGKEHPNYATSLNNLAGLYQAMGNYARAEPQYLQALEIMERALGKEHPNYATSLSNLAGLYQAMGDYARAEPHYVQAMEVTEKTLGKEHPDYATSLSGLAWLYQAMGDYARAEPHYVQALEIEEKALGKEHPDYAASLNNLAGLYRMMGDYARAEPQYAKAMEIREKVLGKGHPDYATSLSNLAGLYQAMGDYARAEPQYLQALEVMEKVLGKGHPDYATSLNNLAGLYQAMGDYARAEPQYLQAMEIMERVLGKEHPNYAAGLSNLAGLYQAMGDYARVEPRYLQALEIMEKALGKEHPNYATSLSSLAGLYQMMGDYARAEPQYLQAMEIMERVLGKEHPNHAAGLNNLAGLYQAMGDYARAVPQYFQALEITEKVLGEGHPNYATSLSSLAGLYQMMGDYARAEPHYAKAMEIREKALGKEHPDYATGLYNLAGLYRMMGDYARAEPLYFQALEIREKVLGQEHLDYAGSLHSLACLYVTTGRHEEAFRFFVRASDVANNNRDRLFSFASERQRLLILEALRPSFSVFMSHLRTNFSSSCYHLQATMDLCLRSKGLTVEALAAQRDAIAAGKYSHLEPKLLELSTLRRQITRREMNGPGNTKPSVHLSLLAEWRGQREVLESELARQIPELQLEQRLRAASREAVAQAMPPGSALLDFVRVGVFDFEAIRAHGDRQWKPARYLAFLLFKEKPDDVLLVDLGEGDAIDQLVSAFVEAIARDRTVESYLASGRALRQRVFDPLARELGGRKRLFLSPDGDLNLLPFEVLPENSGEFLEDNFEISYLSSGRELLRHRMPTVAPPQGSIVAANPDFRLGSSEKVASAFRRQGKSCELQPEDPPTRGRSRASRDIGRGRRVFEPLPGAEEEGERVALRIAASEKWFKDQVLETRLKAIHSPRIVHIATHGFFEEDQKWDPNEESPFMGWDRMKGPGMENPMLRAGLALAGAQTWMDGGEPPEEAEDGLLTAEDVSGMDLVGTEIVALSACDTALGEVRVGEGVYGLRRAFELAGARTIVMSLWKADDVATRELMTVFYDELKNGETRLEALRMARQQVRKKHKHPYYWGGFILQGDPGEMRWD